MSPGSGKPPLWGIGCSDADASSLFSGMPWNEMLRAVRYSISSPTVMAATLAPIAASGAARTEAERHEPDPTIQDVCQGAKGAQLEQCREGHL